MPKPLLRTTKNSQLSFCHLSPRSRQRPKPCTIKSNILEKNNFNYSTVESLMTALESQIAGSDGNLKKSREKEIDEEFDSQFKTKINEEHFLEKHKKTHKLESEFREAAFYKALEQHADTEMMRA